MNKLSLMKQQFYGSKLKGLLITKLTLGYITLFRGLEAIHRYFWGENPTCYYVVLQPLFKMNCFLIYNMAALAIRITEYYVFIIDTINETVNIINSEIEEYRVSNAIEYGTMFEIDDKELYSKYRRVVGIIKKFKFYGIDKYFNMEVWVNE